MPSTAPALTEDPRDPRLDGLRGLAILPVMLYHLTFFGYATSPVDRALVFVPSMGWSFVDLFFVLSGYLITGILWRAKESEHYYGSFYARRALRIIPLYYGVLFFFFVIFPRLTALGDPNAAWLAGSNQQSLWYWLFLENLHVAFTGNFQHHFLGIAWTLSIEEQFYLAWPLVVLHSSRTRLIRICLGMIAGAFLFRVAFVLAGAPGPTISTFTLCRVDTLAMGALIAIVPFEPGAATRLVALARRMLPVTGALWLAVVLWSQYAAAHDPLPPGPLTPDVLSQHALAFTKNPWLVTFGFSFDLAFFASLLVCGRAARSGGWLARWLESGFMRGFGRYSYAMYLLHIFVSEFVRPFYDPQRSELPFVVEHLLWWALNLALVYGVSAVCWYAYESQFLRLKRYFPMGATRQPPAADPAKA
jgi:peptidoglycan/LPS O-acetylase OafA/YrhL